MVPDFPKKTRGMKRTKDEEPPVANDEEAVPKKKKAVRNLDFASHPRRKIVLKFLYFGWEYDGLVQQLNTNRTVEKYLMDALLKTRLISDWKECDFSRCGRTDKGVSAYKQIAALIVRSADPCGEYAFWDNNTDPDTIANYKGKDELPYVRMLNGVLPPHIRVTAWAPVPTSFSARHNCSMRVYKYSMPKANLNVEKMQKACDYLVGQHDFRNFCQIDANEQRVLQKYVRRIFDAQVVVISNENGSYDLIELTVKGSGFLWHMIRYIVTVLHEIGQGNEEPELVPTMLDISKTPCRPQYGLAVETPLCLFDCRAHLLKNMIDDLQQRHTGNKDKGLLQFTQDRALPANYINFDKRLVCSSLEEKLEKLNNDNAYRSFVCDIEKSFLKNKDSAWVDQVLAKQKSEEWMDMFKKYFEECRFTSYGTRAAAADSLLNCVIGKIFERRESAQQLTGDMYKKLSNPQLKHTEDPAKVEELINELCQMLKITQHPDPMVSLEAACAYINKYLNKQFIEQSNKEVKEGKTVQKIAFSDFPTGLPHFQDNIINVAARILRLLNIEAIRNTQTAVNETLVAVQNVTVDKSN